MRRIKCLRRRSSIIHILLVAGCLCDQYVAAAFLCQSLPENTLDALSFAIEASPELLVLCPFEIKGGGCGTTNARTSQSETIGHVVAQGSSQTIVCDLAQLGGKYPDDFDFTGVSKSGQQNRTTSPSHGRGCVIDCPGTHFSVEANASLTVDGFTFRSSKSSAITVASRGQLHVFASAFESNRNPSANGGAIRAAENTFLLINQCDFVKNAALNGGALILEGESQVGDSTFVENTSTASTPMSGGGAIAIGVYALTYLVGNEFFGGGAVNNLGVTILDHSAHSNGTSTVAVGNKGCIISDQMDANSLLQTHQPFCMGIESIDSHSEVSLCATFEVAASCILEAQERSSTVGPTFIPSATPSLRPRPAPTTPSPSVDPCKEDTESFRCMLHELLEALP